MTTAASVPFSPESRLVKVADVAKHLSLSRSAVYGMMERGELPYTKLGKSRRVPLEAVERLVALNTVGGSS